MTKKSPCYPRVTSEDALDACSLIMAVVDSDLISADDILGYVLFALSGEHILQSAPDAKEFSYDFDEPIVFGDNGQSGRLSGNIKVSWTDDMRQIALQWYESEYSDACRCCKACEIM